VLYLIETDTPAVHSSGLVWRAAFDALNATTRETDVVGWFKQHSVIGVILTELDSEASVAREFDARVRRELDKRLNQPTIDRLSIRLHVYPEPKRAPEGEPFPDEPVFLKLPLPSKAPTLYDHVKRVFDVTAGLVLLLLLSPLMLLVAAAVKLRSTGPVLYKQERIGQMGKPFKMLKFRTMHEAADPTIHQEFVTRFIKAGGAVEEPGQSGLFKITRDPRVIPGGRFLRKTSMDELPQLWNVIRGEMSLVGPRPPLPYEVEHYKYWHHRRVLEVKPGITGLWQVKGRSRTTFDEMVRLDLEYARTCSLWTDLKILLATPAAVIAGKGAC
jgi:lipopolysaccharide/colanic/teichoic acid biosynthesis glycosyltransferase